MRNIDWTILAVLYEKKSITRAAEALYMTQSALSKRIKEIEIEWNISIIQRSNQGINFTEDGKYLCKKANVMLDFLQEIEHHFSDNNVPKEQLRIGVPNSFARLYMAKVLGKYKEEYNKLEIQTVINSSDILYKQLMDGGIDIGIICGDFSYLGEKTCLFSEDLYVLAPRNARMDDLDKYALIESYLNPTVKPMVDQWWKNEFGNRPHPAHKVPYSDIAIEMVENGLGITLLFGKEWNIDIEKIQMIPAFDRNGEPVKRNVWLLMSDKCFKSSDIMDFISLIEKHFRVNI